MSLSLFKRAFSSVVKVSNVTHPARISGFRPVIAPFSSASAAVETETDSPPPPEPEADAEEGKAGKVTRPSMPTMKVFKRDVTQSPKKVRFLLKLVRGAWVPDALAQMKFTPKHKAVEVSALIRVRQRRLYEIYIICSTIFFYEHLIIFFLVCFFSLIARVCCVESLSRPDP
jgi:hypothetical protein